MTRSISSLSNPQAEYAPWAARYGLLEPYGKCQCGCGQDTLIAKTTRTARGQLRGQPLRFVLGHSRRQGDSEKGSSRLDVRAGHRHTKLTGSNVTRIRMLRRAGLSYPTIAGMFGVAKSTIGKIVHREVWQDVP